MFKVFRSLGFMNDRIFHLTRSCGAVVLSHKIDVVKREISSDMKKYFEIHGLSDVVKQVPEKYLKSTKNPEFCTIVDPKLAKKIVFAICSKIDEGCIVESDPGLGLMSEMFVQIAPRVTLCEGNDDFLVQLKPLKMKFEGLNIFDFNFKTLAKMTLAATEIPIPEVVSFFQHVSAQLKIDDRQKICWVFSALKFRFIRTLCFIQSCDIYFQPHEKMEYYTLIESQMWKKLTTLPNELNFRVAAISVLFQVIFDHEILMNGIPRKMFLPWKNSKEVLDDELILLRVIPKADLSNFFNSPEVARSFVKFLEIGMRRNKRIIPVLEKYINNCGPIFIMNHDLTVYTEFCELSPPKLLSIFQAFINLPEFCHSSFVDTHVEDSPAEEEADDEDLGDGDNDDGEKIDDENVGNYNNEAVDDHSEQMAFKKFDTEHTRVS